MTILDIYNYYDTICPYNTAMDFDNPGLNIGDLNKECKRVLFALDCSMDVARFAYENKCDLIITHHPLIFNPIKAIHSDDVVYYLINKDISLLSLHTNLDTAENGVNDVLCKKIGLKRVNKIQTDDGYTLNCGIVNPMPAEIFAKELHNSLNVPVKYACKEGKIISNVLVCSGSGGNYIEFAHKSGYDALVTADVKHDKFIYANNYGIALYDCGHFETENIIIEPLLTDFTSHFNNISAISYNSSPIRYCY